MVRFIPTYVGHTTETATAPLLPAVHPHIRGAYNLPSPRKYIQSGSSPHTWGIRDGKRRLLPDPGSSPHTWGIRHSPTSYSTSERFIPTYVGHTRNPATNPFVLWFIPTYVGHTQIPYRGICPASVHPHIRGAYIKKKISAEISDGSSPHTWGIRAFRLLPVHDARFIPTYVGHTPTRGQRCRE